MALIRPRVNTVEKTLRLGCCRSTNEIVKKRRTPCHHEGMPPKSWRVSSPKQPRLHHLVWNELNRQQTSFKRILTSMELTPVVYILLTPIWTISSKSTTSLLVKTNRTRTRSQGPTFSVPTLLASIHTCSILPLPIAATFQRKTPNVSHCLLLIDFEFSAWKQPVCSFSLCCNCFANNLQSWD